jgi:hypothetical protein
MLLQIVFFFDGHSFVPMPNWQTLCWGLRLLPIEKVLILVLLSICEKQWF